MTDTRFVGKMRAEERAVVKSLVFVGLSTVRADIKLKRPVANRRMGIDRSVGDDPKGGYERLDLTETCIVAIIQGIPRARAPVRLAV